MHHSHGALAIILALMLTACASQSRYDLDMSMTELSGAIAASDGERVQADADIRFGPTVTTGVWFAGRNSNGMDGFANNRVVMSYRQSLDLDYTAYRAGPGIEFSFTGGDDVHQFRGALFIQSASFVEGVVEGYNSPALVGFDLGIQAIFDEDPIEFFAGIQGSVGALVYNFSSPVQIGYETFSGDSLGIYGLGVPLGMHVMMGQLSLEAVYTPTVYLHASETSLGAGNDLVTWSVQAPLSVGVGFNW